MFERLFKHPDDVHRHRLAPLLSERLRFLEHLAGEQLADSTLRVVAYYLLVVINYLRLVERPTAVISSTEIKEAATRWSTSDQTRNRKARPLFTGHATRWLQFLGRWEPSAPSHAFVAQIDAYAHFMREDRGLSPRTAFTRCWMVTDFLPRLGTALSEATITRIDEALAQKITLGRYARVSVQTYASVLRDFFLFAERRGWCRQVWPRRFEALVFFPKSRCPVPCPGNMSPP
jgi:hypothetical protein